MKMTLNEAEAKIKEFWPDAEYEIIEFNGATKPFKFKCLKCNRITEKSTFNSIFQHPKFCYQCDRKLYDDQVDNILKEQNLIPKRHYFLKRSDGKGNHHMVTIHCNKCGNTWDRNTTDIIGKEVQGCPYCKKTRSSKIEFEKKLYECTQGDFSLISDFKSNNKAVLIKHEECGFIFRYKPKSLIINKTISCPKCKHYQSKGEEKIRKYLEEYNIPYESQVRFYDLGKYSYDFKIEMNDKKYLIEFQGIQHFEPVKHFGGKHNFERQKQNDKIKKEYAEQNGYILIEIPYYDILKVNSYLDNIVQRLK